MLAVAQLDQRIIDLQARLTAGAADFAREQTALKRQIAKLQAVRAQITPEMEALLTQLNAALS